MRENIKALLDLWLETYIIFLFWYTMYHNKKIWGYGFPAKLGLMERFKADLAHKISSLNTTKICLSWHSNPFLCHQFLIDLTRNSKGCVVIFIASLWRHTKTKTTRLEISLITSVNQPYLCRMTCMHRVSYMGSWKVVSPSMVNSESRNHIVLTTFKS